MRWRGRPSLTRPEDQPHAEFPTVTSGRPLNKKLREKAGMGSADAAIKMVCFGRSPDESFFMRHSSDLKHGGGVKDLF